YSHYGAHCKANFRCKYCTQDHYIKDNQCPQVECVAEKGRSCSHTVRKYTSCEEKSHFARDRHCSTRI
ncbi:hypothetical protein C7212DRAFT_129530, partial [Tuber magnatum]